MNESDRVDWPYGLANDLPEHLWAYDEPALGDGQPTVDLSAGLVSLTFIKDAIRRGRKVWLATLALGLLIGAGLFVKFPPAYTATSSVLVKAGYEQDPAVEIETDAALAHSNAVAAGAVKQLGLSQSPASLLAAYTVIVVTDQVLLFTVKAPSSEAAMRTASAITTQFLKFRAQYAQAQQSEEEVALNQQAAKAQQALDAINSQISQLGSAAPDSLKTKQTNASNALLTVQQYVTDTLATSRTATQTMISYSQVLDAPTVQPMSHIKRPLLYVAGGIVGGLFVGIVIVVVAALLTDRLRRRDDIAEALGVPVRLSVGPLSAGRLSIGKRAAGRSSSIKRTANFLPTVVPHGQRKVALGLVAVDNEEDVAPVIVELAKSAAAGGRQVIVADLTSGTPAARLLGVSEPGVRPVNVERGTVVVAVPEKDSIAPTGPIPPRTANGWPDADEALLSAARTTDLILTLADLDPAVGAAHLATWATTVVTLVTAGQSSAARLRAVGEMLRLTGLRPGATVLIGADKADQTLGLVDAWQDQPPVVADRI